MWFHWKDDFKIMTKYQEKIGQAPQAAVPYPSRVWKIRSFATPLAPGVFVSDLDKKILAGRSKWQRKNVDIIPNAKVGPLSRFRGGIRGEVR